MSVPVLLRVASNRGSAWLSGAGRRSLYCRTPKLLGQDLALSHLLIPQVLSACCVPGHVLGAGEDAQGSCPHQTPSDCARGCWHG